MNRDEGGTKLFRVGSSGNPFAPTMETAVADGKARLAKPPVPARPHDPENVVVLDCADTAFGAIVNWLIILFPVLDDLPPPPTNEKGDDPEGDYYDHLQQFEAPSEKTLSQIRVVSLSWKGRVTDFRTSNTWEKERADNRTVDGYVAYPDCVPHLAPPPQDLLWSHWGIWNLPPDATTEAEPLQNVEGYERAFSYLRFRL